MVAAVSVMSLVIGLEQVVCISEQPNHSWSDLFIFEVGDRWCLGVASTAKSGLGCVSHDRSVQEGYCNYCNHFG